MQRVGTNLKEGQYLKDAAEKNVSAYRMVFEWTHPSGLSKRLIDPSRIETPLQS
jgi:hypothetical protein